ncbi:LytTR family DNA-binding domain-containing protein [Psychrobacter sp. M13]|uniref:LytR/AlgR family response regulator transcription factor n=1 Tax=Psychrobacter sp. M13 TaxID=3067275 RepID=UPI00273B21CC|nr:LytTR family DNA-binding domain-containing protein [Psychrobacter sp. M13]WLP93748.1 LytTR family DNA-binding domain-containing protein [Psychrobacter sp. M13]
MNVYVVEDEVLARQELIYLLKDTGVVNVIGEAEDIQQALWDINEKQPDAVFLDIELENGNGLNLAKQFNNMKKPPMIVFVTAYSEYALHAFELDAIDYIVKPIDKVRLLKAVDKLVNLNSKLDSENIVESAPLLSKEKKYSITVKEDDRIIVINTKDILYIGTEDRQAYIQTLDKKYLTDELLYKLMDKLGDRFVQVHRGYIVNVKQIAVLEPWFNRTYLIVLKDGSKISVSRSYVKTIKQVLGL